MFLKNQLLDILAFTQTYRPQTLNTYKTFGVESEFEVENDQLLCLNRTFSETTSMKSL